MSRSLRGSVFWRVDYRALRHGPRDVPPEDKPGNPALPIGASPLRPHHLQTRLGKNLREGSDGGSVIVFYALVQIFPGDEAVVELIGIVAWLAVAPAVAESLDVPAAVFHLGHVFHFVVGEVVEDFRVALCLYGDEEQSPTSACTRQVGTAGRSYWKFLGGSCHGMTLASLT